MQEIHEIHEPPTGMEGLASVLMTCIMSNSEKNRIVEKFGSGIRDFVLCVQRYDAQFLTEYPATNPVVWNEVNSIDLLIGLAACCSRLPSMSVEAKSVANDEFIKRNPTMCIDLACVMFANSEKSPRTRNVMGDLFARLCEARTQSLLQKLTLLN
jgi:hypothetical protein